MFNGDINQRVETLLNLANSGGNPQTIMQQMMSRGFNANTQQLNTAMTQMKNMAGGRSMPEFYIQMLKQNGLNDKNAEGLARLLGVK
jgi:hypothetical protein